MTRRGPVLAALALVGAAPASALEDRNGPWYGRNHDRRRAMLELCENDPGRLHLHPDCVNARNGDVRALVQELETQRRPPALAPFAQRSRARRHRL